MPQTEKQQKFYDSYQDINGIINGFGTKRAMVICDQSFDMFAIPIRDYLLKLPCEMTFFSEVTPNPSYHEVKKGIRKFIEKNCDCIISVGGGSVIDVAKCITILDDNDKDTPTTLKSPRCTHLAIPTTAGSGSESTKFAVIYNNGQKLSIEHKKLAPDFVVLESAFLETLPLYQKKSTLLDALCQAIESMWAKEATEISSGYAMQAKEIILNNADAYIAGDKASARIMLKASNLSGRAINITKTTAAHAMSYVLSTTFGIAHGHAVALCLPHVWEHYIANGKLRYREQEKQKEDLKNFIAFTEKLDMFRAGTAKMKENNAIHKGRIKIAHFVDSVNIQRLKNHPIKISKHELADMYKRILKGKYGQ